VSIPVLGALLTQAQAACGREHAKKHVAFSQQISWFGFFL